MGGSSPNQLSAYTPSPKKLVPLVPAGPVHTKTSEASKKEEYQRRSIGHLRARATCGEGGQRKNLPNLFFAFCFPNLFQTPPPPQPRARAVPRSLVVRLTAVECIGGDDVRGGAVRGVRHVMTVPLGPVRLLAGHVLAVTLRVIARQTVLHALAHLRRVKVAKLRQIRDARDEVISDVGRLPCGDVGAVANPDVVAPVARLRPLQVAVVRVSPVLAVLLVLGSTHARTSCKLR